MNFTHDELREIWHALAQYCANCEELDDGNSNAPFAAETAMEKLDIYFSKAGECPDDN